MTETDGVGLDFEGLYAAMGRFGGHQARDGADVKLKHFSHNGIGTKSPMSIFANQMSARDIPVLSAPLCLACVIVA